MVATVHKRKLRFDHVIAGTGYRVDLSSQPELARIYPHIASWRDRYRPAFGEDNLAAASHPYLGPGFQFLPRENSGAEFLRNIHCFNLAATVSFGKSIGNISSVAEQPRLISGIARDLFVEGVDIAAHERYIRTPVTPPDPTPYQRAVTGDRREVA